MKRLFLYLLARVKGQPISWVRASYDAMYFDVESAVCRRLDGWFITIADIVTFGKYSAKKTAGESIGHAASTSSSFLTKYFLGRLVLCALKGSTDSQFLFYGRRAVP